MSRMLLGNADCLENIEMPEGEMRIVNNEDYERQYLIGNT